MDHTPSHKSCLITVGTTRFDALIEALDSSASQVIQALNHRHITHIRIQIGNGVFYPENLIAIARQSKMTIEVCKFVDNFDKVIGESDLVISHAGAGSILEALRAGKPLIVVVNTGLMDNHQAELAHQLSIKSHLCATDVDGIVSLLSTVDLSTLIPLPQSNSRQFAQEVDREMGFQMT